MKTMKTSDIGNSFLLLLLVVLSTTAQAQTNSTLTAQQELEFASQLAANRPIEAGQSYWIEELTWMEIRDLIAMARRLLSSQPVVLRRTDLT